MRLQNFMTEYNGKATTDMPCKCRLHTALVLHGTVKKFEHLLRLKPVSTSLEGLVSDRFESVF